MNAVESVEGNKKIIEYLVNQMAKKQVKYWFINSFKYIIAVVQYFEFLAFLSL